MPTVIARLNAAFTIATLIACGSPPPANTATGAADVTKSDTITLTINPPGALRWTRQLGTSSDDIARGIATDTNGDVYTTGDTFGALAGSSAGGRDAFIRSYGR